MKNKKLFFIIISCVAVFFCGEAFAVKSVIKGDPELLWRTPLGKEDIENNEYNRCLLIKKVKPGVLKASETNRNVYELLSEYTANLYTQSIKTAAYIEEESQKEKDKDEGDLSNEQTIIKTKITRKLSEIARRVNIINSLDAGTSMLTSLIEMTKQNRTVFDEVDCEDLK